jgi:hypothetical protein
VVGCSTIFAAAALALAQGASDAFEVYAFITIDHLVLAADAPAPFLSERGWVVGGKLATDPKRELLDWAGRQNLCAGVCNERSFMYVSLGPEPTFGAFLRTAQSLRRMGLCHNVFVKEGGLLGGNVVSTLDNTMLGLDVC